MNIKKKQLQPRVILSALALFLLSAVTSHAQSLPCGNIVSPGNVSDLNLGIENDVIEDCNDPFGVTIDPPNPYTVQINGESITSGAVLSLPEGRTNNISFLGNPGLSRVNTGIFKHVGNNYEYVSTEASEPTEADYRAFAETYFSTQAERDLYIEIIIYNFENTNLDQYFIDPITGENVIDEVTGETVQARYYGFIEAVYENFDDSAPYLEAGTYTVLFYEYYLELSNRTIWDSVKDFFIPTAYAQCVQCIPPRFYTITFTITEALPEPTGASSILFLPGIQASRLYKDDFFGGGRDQVWPPNAFFNEDIYDLKMSSTGVSEEPIYTDDIIDTSAGVGDVYASFKAFLDQLKDEETIDDWHPYAYDWRYSVTDVAQNGTQYRDEIKDAVVELERLAESSFSKKVTIIGHSNGGLLAKAITRRLESEGKVNLVDKIILLASPQLGTPKAIGTILHGYDQTDSYGGFVMDGKIVREVTNNLPGAYGLLPSEKYFDGLDTPLVTFSDSAVTTPYRQTYGSNISSYNDYVRFLRGEDGFDRDLNNAPSMPARANGLMLSDALTMHDTELDDWTAPSNIQVIEIVGTGLATMRSIEYREILEDKCLSAGPLQVCTPVAEIKPYAVLTKYGDGTVVQRSAEGYVGVKGKYFVNLEALNVNNGSQPVFHHNITEAAPLQDLLADIIVSETPENNQFVSTSYTEFNNLYDVEMIDSPVRLLATDTEGNQTGVVIIDGVRIIKQEIPRSQYFEFGNTKYLLVPKGTDRTTRLYGEEYGGYTLTTAALGADDVQTIQTILANASTSPNMFAEYSNENGVFGTVQTDSNGDGVIDFETTLDGELIAQEVIVSYPTLITTVEALNLSKARKQALLLIIKSAEHYGNKTPSRSLYRNLEEALLKSAQELIKLYTKKRYITSAETTVLLEMIKVLKDKQ